MQFHEMESNLNPSTFTKRQVKLQSFMMLSTFIHKFHLSNLFRYENYSSSKLNVIVLRFAKWSLVHNISGYIKLIKNYTW